MSDDDALKLGARNLLFNCAKLCSGDKVLIINEDPNLGWYDQEVSSYVSKEAENNKIAVTQLQVGAPDNSDKKELEELINEYDCTIFFARLGDQDRFETKKFRKKRVMSYVKNLENLRSNFGTLPYQAMIDLKGAIDQTLSEANHIQITCPLGSNFSGVITKEVEKKEEEVSVFRFPMVVPKPFSSKNFSGIIVINNCLTPTGSKVYQPSSLLIQNPLSIYIKDCKIVDLKGTSSDIKNFENHYDWISKKFNIDKNFVHSWHAGIHPSISYKNTMRENPDKWSNTLFASPKYLHFHTCGNYAPGEICWMIPDHTIKIDSVAMWKKGEFKPQGFKTIEECLIKWPSMNEIFSSQSLE